MNKLDEIIIEKFDFNKKGLVDLSLYQYGKEWPVTYIIKNENKIYIGETTDAYIRMMQHMEDEKKKGLQTIYILTTKQFNKSVILDLEHFLIKYISADNKYRTVLNGNMGLKVNNYYMRNEYKTIFINLWKKLQKLDIVDHDLEKIESSKLFKFSPFNSLTSDQYVVVSTLLKKISDDIINNYRNKTYVINGGSGTGKTVLGIYLLKLFVDDNKDFYYLNYEDYENLKIIKNYIKGKNSVKYIVPLRSLHSTICKAFKSISGLNSNMSIRPTDICEIDDCSIAIVDEARRLRRPKSLAFGNNYQTFKEKSKRIGLSEDSNELDWIINKCDIKIFFYDDLQTVRPTDIPSDYFRKLLLPNNDRLIKLTTQVRCIDGGEEYVDYIKSLFSNNKKVKKDFAFYDFKMFKDANKMIKEIKKLDKKYSINNSNGLCRVVSGISYSYSGKIDIGNNTYVWNLDKDDWVNQENSVNEIGCIHTIQGYDLNYTGVIVGRELTFNKTTGKIEVLSYNYKDIRGKDNLTSDELLQYIFNIYYILATRGVHGTYLYIADDNLREYFENYIDYFD